MVRLVPIRGGDPPKTLVLVREGVQTLSDTALEQACARTYELMGLHGFSVLEVPEGGYQELARLRPLLRTRRRIMIASGRDLTTAGFALVPTMDYPHWTVVVSEPTSARFALVRAQFSAPVLNPAYVSQRD
ncbi:MAG: hypothetical protein QM655_12025 [Nocardioidaceae bacterium]